LGIRRMCASRFYRPLRLAAPWLERCPGPIFEVAGLEIPARACYHMADVQPVADAVDGAKAAGGADTGRGQAPVRWSAAGGSVLSVVRPGQLPRAVARRL